MLVITGLQRHYWLVEPTPLFPNNCHTSPIFFLFSCRFFNWPYWGASHHKPVTAISEYERNPYHYPRYILVSLTIGSSLWHKGITDKRDSAAAIPCDFLRLIFSLKHMKVPCSEMRHSTICYLCYFFDVLGCKLARIINNVLYDDNFWLKWSIVDKLKP